jgi:D-serine ammonia-lyase
MDLFSIYQYPVPSVAALKLQYTGKNIQDVDPPAAIIDRAVVRENCNAMLQASTRLSIGFRAHVKTHKVSINFFSLYVSALFVLETMCVDFSR